MKYALFKDGKQISKPHSTKIAVEVEAYEKDMVGTNPRRGKYLMGCEIKEVEET